MELYHLLLDSIGLSEKANESLYSQLHCMTLSRYSICIPLYCRSFLLFLVYFIEGASDCILYKVSFSK